MDHAQKNPADAGFVENNKAVLRENLIQLLFEIFAYQHLQQFITIDFTNHRTCVIVIGNVGGILGEDVTNNLIDGIISLLLQSLIDGGEDQADLGIFVYCDFKFTGKIIHRIPPFSS